KAVQQKRDNDTDGKKNSFGALAHGRNLFFYGYKSTQFRQPYESGREITLNSGNRRNLPLFSPVQSPALRTKKHSLISRKFINFACANGLPLAASFIHEPTRTWLKKQKTTTILFRLMTGSSPST